MLCLPLAAIVACIIAYNTFIQFQGSAFNTDQFTTSTSPPTVAAPSTDTTTQASPNGAKKLP